MLELDFDLKPDADGIFDGRELANALMQTAYALLTPYVNGCPACADALFSAIANNAIVELHQDTRLPSRTMCTQADTNGERFRKHASTTKDLTKELLEGMSSDPAHIH